MPDFYPTQRAGYRTGRLGTGLPGMDPEDDIADPFAAPMEFDAGDDAYGAGLAGARGELAGNPEPFHADMDFSLDETPDAAYEAGLADARAEMSAPLNLPGLGPAAAPQPASVPGLPPMAPQNAPAPAVAGTPPTVPPVSPSSPQAATPTGAGALTPTPQPTSQANLDPGAPVEQAQRAPSPVQSAPSSDARTGGGGLGIGLWDPSVGSGEVRRRQVGEGKSMNRVRLPGFADEGEEKQARAQERTALEDARRQDRNRRIGAGIANAIGSIIAMLGAGTGNTALMGAGMGIGSIGRTIPQGAMERRALEDQTRRREDIAAEQTAAARDQQLGTARIGAEADATRAEAGLLGERSEAELRAIQGADLAAERAAQEGSVEGMREAIRARIASMGASNPSRGPNSEFARRGGALDSINDMDTLHRIYVETGDQDIRRGGQGAGGSGGGGHAEYVRQPDGTYIERRTGRRVQRPPEQQGDPFAPAAAPGPVAEPASEIVDPFAPPPTAPAAAPQARPAARAGRQRPPVPVAQPSAPTAAPGGTPVTAPADGTRVVDATDAGSIGRYERVLRELGHGNDDVSNQVDTYTQDMQSGDTARRNAAAQRLSEREYELAQARAAGLPAGVSNQQWQRANGGDFGEHVQFWGDTRAAVQRLRGYRERSPQNYRRALILAGQNSPLTGVDPETAEMARDMTAHLIPTLSRIAGANVTSQELGRVQQSMGLGSLTAALSNPEGFERNLTNALASVQRLTRQQIAAGIGNRAAAHVFSRSLGGTPQYWERVFGGAR